MSEDERKTTLDAVMGVRERDLSKIRAIEEVYASEAKSLDPHRFGLLAVYHFGVRAGAKLP